MTAQTQAPRRFKIGSKTYQTVAIQDLSLAMLLELEDELAGSRWPLTTADIRRIGREIEALPENERADHPRVLLMTAIGVWAARRVAGEAVTLDEAMNVKLSDLKALPATADRRPPANPTKARTGSARAAKSQPRKAGSPPSS